MICKVGAAAKSDLQCALQAARKTDSAAGIATAAATGTHLLQLGFMIATISSIGLYFISRRCVA